MFIHVFVYALSLSVCYMHGELWLVLAYLPAPALFFTPSLARLKASRARERRVGGRLTGWHQSPGEWGDEGETGGDICLRHQESSRRGFHQPFSAFSGAANSREPPADCLCCLKAARLGWRRNANAPHRSTHVLTHASKSIIAQSRRRIETNKQ